MRQQGFEPRLESLRGIAALIVGIHHTFGRSTPGIPGTIADWILWPTHSQASVMLFFVLSGYVLGLALERDGAFLPYVIRRAFRLLPVLIISILLAYALVTYFGEEFGRRLPTLDDLRNNLLLRDYLVNAPSWTLYPEIIGSLALPALVYLHVKTPKTWQWPLFIAIAAALSFSSYRLVLWFYVGFFLPGEIAKLAARSLALRIVFVILGYAILLTIAPIAEYYKFKTIAPSAVGGALMIGALISNAQFMSWLSAAPLRFLGRISYSLYLLHWPIYYVWSVAYRAWAPPPGFLTELSLCLLSLTSAIVVSAISHRWIELPAIQLGKSIASQLFGSRRGTVDAPQPATPKSGD